MPTFKAAFFLVAFLALAGCAGGLGVSRDAPQRVALPDGFVIAGADGWCIDKATSRATANTSVVVLGSCAAISGSPRLPQPDVPGVVTVSVETDAGDLPDGATLRKFFTTETGRAVLARDGRAESVRILESRTDADLVYLRTADKSVGEGGERFG